MELQNDAEKIICPLISERLRNGDAGPSIHVLESSCRGMETTQTSNSPKTTNVIGDLHLPNEDSEVTRVKESKSDSPETSSSIEDDFCSTIEPLPTPVWTGSFQIYGKNSCTVPVMMAHVSNEACIEASEVASSLPVILSLEMVSKVNIWPMKFKKMMPTVHNIAVYFFPDHRAERVYDCLVEDIIDHEFAMISRINNVELLIFSSCELPPNNWRLKRKYYLWGIIRRKKKTLTQNQSDDCVYNLHGSMNHTSPSILSTEMCAKETKLHTKKFRFSPPNTGDN
ncbi:hypothetical protein SOVF_090090 [Spinacia oleracea]|nr:hypothetical protein SOVF_090090 [Spinacia oleracea]